MSDDEISKAALDFANRNKKDICARLTDISLFPPDPIPVTVFMAGSPGAGKTEAARNLIKNLSGKNNILHIDPDEVRNELPNYNGKNSSLFQAATTTIASCMQDYALKQKQSYIFDSTLTSLELAKQNIDRNLNRGRSVYIMYVYQDPIQAWEFVKAREKKDGRVIPRDAFIQKYFKARENVNNLKAVYGSDIQVYLIVKNNDGTDFNYYQNIENIDNYLPERYTIERLQALIN